MTSHLPPPLAGYAWGEPRSFLGVDEAEAGLGDAACVVLPVPYEATTSWGGGTRSGPDAFLEASRYLELYDEELDDEPYRRGVVTLPPLELTAGGPEAAVAELRSAYDALLDETDGGFVVVVGGEHSISSAPALAWHERLGGELSILQLDAHADLRDSYRGTPWSHACVMRRILEHTSEVVAVGVRSLTREERDVGRERDVTTLFAEELREEGWVERAVEALGPDVYLTFDLDFFDPSLVPATGTPEPGGGDWWQALDLLRVLFRERNVVGADIVELAPREGQEASATVAAKLAYKMIGYRTMNGPGGR